METIHALPAICRGAFSKDICEHTMEMSALGSVQSAEPSLAERVRSATGSFSTHFCTNVLKTVVRRMRAEKMKAAHARAAQENLQKPTNLRLLPATSDRCRSWRGRSARRHALRALPSGGSSCPPAGPQA